MRDDVDDGEVLESWCMAGTLCSIPKGMGQWL